jgi:hypothetical protein
MALLSLIARLTLDKTGFDSGLKGAENSASSFGTSFSKKLGKAFTGGAVAAALMSLARGAIDAAEEVDTLAQKLNVTHETAQKLRLEDKLKSGAGPGNLFFNDHDIKNLTVADRLWTKIYENAKVLIGKAFGLTGYIPGTIGSLVKFAGQQGIVSSAPPSDRPASEVFLEGKKKQAEAVGTLFELEKAQQEQTLKNNYAMLTDAQKLNGLLADRADLTSYIQGIERKIGPRTFDEEMDLQAAKLALARTQADIIGKKSEIPSPLRNDAGSIGAFSGGLSAQSSITGLSRQTVFELQKLNDLLRTNGIKIKDVVR